jgi:hypothetical protein
VFLVEWSCYSIISVQSNLYHGEIRFTLQTMPKLIATIVTAPRMFPLSEFALQPIGPFTSSPTLISTDAMGHHKVGSIE